LDTEGPDTVLFTLQAVANAVALLSTAGNVVLEKMCKVFYLRIAHWYFYDNAIVEPEHHACKASHCGSKQRYRSHAVIALLSLIYATYVWVIFFATSCFW